MATVDFNADRKPDYVLYNAGMRQIAIWYMNNNLFMSGAFGPTLPAGWSWSDSDQGLGSAKPHRACSAGANIVEVLIGNSAAS